MKLENGPQMRAQVVDAVPHQLLGPLTKRHRSYSDNLSIGSNGGGGKSVVVVHAR